MTSRQYVVYWQPGCTSCLKTKEFLKRNGIAFESINVRADPDAGARLAALGARSIPVIARGAQWVYGQDLDAVARFLGVSADRTRLPVATLVLRIERLLAAVSRYTTQLPENVLETLLPGRADRAALDLAFHVPMIVAGFLDAARGGSLNFEYFERRPLRGQRNRAAVIATQQEIAADFRAWSQGDVANLPASLDTYYGPQPLAGALERTAWHVAQHARQLESLVAGAGLVPDGSLAADELAGLPLPEGLWDPEIGATG
jgi:glutaredoxin